MTAFLLALITPALWAINNHIDKHIIDKYFKNTGVGALLIFSSLIGFFVLPVAFIYQTQAFNMPLLHSLVVVINGCLYLVATLPYLKALKISDVSASVPIFQIIPVLSFILGWFFLGELLAVNEVVGGLVVIVGAAILSIELGESKKLGFRIDTLSLMFLSSFLYALHFFLFKYFAIENDFWSIAFYESIGFCVFAVFLFSIISKFRTDFISVFKNNGKTIVSYLTFSEVINIIGKLLFNRVSMFISLALAWVAVSFQPVFVFIFSVLLAIFMPQVRLENVLGKHFIHKLGSILLMLIGVVIIYLL